MLRVFRVLSLVLVLGGVFFQARQAWQAAVAARLSNRVDQNFVAEWEQRLANLREDLPVEVTVIGYVADWDIPNSSWDAIDQSTEYVLTQYTLSPRIIQRGFGLTWTIGNFTNPDYRAWLDQNLSEYELDDYGAGIVLIRTGGALP